MILTILNNSRLGLKLFVVWLILGVGLLPDKTEGLKCYKCDGAACKSAPPDTDCASGFCLTINKGKDSEKKDCAASAKEGECIQKMGGCFTGTDDNKADMDTCLGTEAKTVVDTGTELCVCEGDHCNGEKKDDKKTDDKKDDKKDDGTDDKKDDDKTNDDRFQCYTCRVEAECNKDDNSLEKKDCLSPKPFCMKTVLSGKVIIRGCMTSKKEQDCYKGGKCMSYKEEAECTGAKNHPAGENSPAKVCGCEGNLCNGGGDDSFGERIISNSFLVYLLAMMGISAI